MFCTAVYRTMLFISVDTCIVMVIELVWMTLWSVQNAVSKVTTLVTFQSDVPYYIWWLFHPFSTNFGDFKTLRSGYSDFSMFQVWHQVFQCWQLFTAGEQTLHCVIIRAVFWFYDEIIVTFPFPFPFWSLLWCIKSLNMFTFLLYQCTQHVKIQNVYCIF